MPRPLEESVQHDIQEAVEAGERRAQRLNGPFSSRWWESKNAQLQQGANNLNEKHPVAAGVTRSLLWFGIGIFFLKAGYWNVAAPCFLLSGINVNQTQRRLHRNH